MSGLIIKKFRERNNYSQKELASILDVSVRTIARWEQNNTKPNSDELKKLATLLGVTEVEILNDTDTDINSSTEQSNQNLIAKISDSVDNLVTGQDTINKSIISSRDEFQARQTELIRELQNQNAELLRKLEDNDRKQEAQKALLKQRRIKLAVMISLAILIILLVAAFLWYLATYGTNPDELLAGQPVVQKTYV